VMSTQRAVRTVVIQDRSRLYRESLQLLLPSVSSLEVVQVVEAGDALVEACLSTQPDAVMFEAAAVPWSPVGLVPRIRRTEEEPVLVGTYPQDHRRSQLLERVSCVPRSASSAVMVRALQGDGSGVDSETTMPSNRATAVSDSLTQREFQILALISGGFTTAQMAARLGISAKTIESRRQTLFSKLGVQNQSHAIAVAMRSGLLGIGTGAHGDR
jgi:DNA-binding NarL/FixJ family response regulator